MMHVDPKIVKAVANCASSQPSRYALTGVLCEDHGDGKGRMVGSDGKILCRVDFKHHSPDDFPKEIPPVKAAPNGSKKAILPAKALAKVVSGANVSGKKGIPVTQKPVLIMGEHISTVVGTDLERHSSDWLTPVEGSYPAYEDVVPRKKDADGASVSFNPELMIKLCQAAIAINPRTPVMRVQLHGKLKAATVWCKAHDGSVEMNALIMPLTIDI